MKIFQRIFAYFYNVMHGRVVISYWYYRTIYQSHLQQSIKPLKMELIGCPETSVRNYQSTLNKELQESKSLLHRGGSLKWRIISNNFNIFLYIYIYIYIVLMLLPHFQLVQHNSARLGSQAPSFYGAVWKLSLYVSS